MGQYPLRIGPEPSSASALPPVADREFRQRRVVDHRVVAGQARFAQDTLERRPGLGGMAEFPPGDGDGGVDVVETGVE